MGCTSALHALQGPCACASLVQKTADASALCRMSSDLRHFLIASTSHCTPSRTPLLLTKHMASQDECNTELTHRKPTTTLSSCAHCQRFT